MTLPLSAAKVAHARLMVDTCTISRVATGSFDDSTGQRVEVSRTIYTGACRVKISAVSPVAERNAGERANVVTAPTLVLPGDNVSDIRERDVVTITASASPALVGRVFSIIGADSATTASARRFLIEGRA